MVDSTYDPLRHTFVPLLLESACFTVIGHYQLRTDDFSITRYGQEKLTRTNVGKRVCVHPPSQVRHISLSSPHLLLLKTLRNPVP
jgi:hypothetical protein